MVTENVLIEVTEKGAKTVKRNIEDIGKSSSQANKSVDLLKGALASLAAALSVRQLASMVDQFTNLQNRLKLVTNGTNQLRQATDQLLNISQRSRSDLSGTVALYSRLAQNAKQLGVNQSELATITETVNKAMIVSGASVSEAAGGLRQLTQGLASGTLRGDELNSVLENLPRVARLISDELGVTVGQLREMGADGLITSQNLVDAFRNGASVIDAEFAKTSSTIEQAFGSLTDGLVVSVGRMNEASGASQLLVGLLDFLTENVDTLARAAIAAGIALSVSFAAKGVLVAVSAVKALTVAIATNPIGAIAITALAAVSALVAFSDTITIGSGSLATLADVGKAAFEVIGPAVTSALSTIQAFFPAVSRSIQAIVGDAGISISGLLKLSASAVDTMVGLFKGLADAIPIAFRNLPRSLELVFVNSFNKILELSADVTNKIIANINKIAGAVGLPLINQVKALRIPLSTEAQAIGKAIDEAIKKGIDSQSSATEAIEGILARANEIAASRQFAELNENLQETESNVDKLTDATGDLKDKGAEFVAKLQEELDAIGKTNAELQKMEAAKLGVSKQADVLIDAIEAQTIAQKLFDDELKRGADITSATSTAAEQYAVALEELDRLYAKNIISAETYDRALVKLDEDFDKLSKTSKSAFGDTEQFGIQAARNLQTNFANFLFDPFDDGLEGMFKGFVDILRRMAAEIVSSKILQTLFNSFSGSGTSGSSASSFGGFFSSLTGGSAGSTFGNNGGAGTAFIGGPGTAIGGTGTSVGTAGFNASAGLGVLAAGALGVGIGQGIAGESRVFGANGTLVSGITAGVGAGIGAAFFGPAGAQVGAGIGGAIGGVITKLFGREPFKQRESTLELNVSGDDIAGALITRFLSKGGFFRGDKTDNVINDLGTGNLLNAFNGFRESGIDKSLFEFAEQAGETAQVIGILANTQMARFAAVLRDTATLFGVSSAGLDTFSTTLKLVGEKGKALGESEINQLFADLADQMTRAVAPAIGTLSKTGESAFETVLRLGDQFVALTRASNVLGLSLEAAEAHVLSMSLAQQTALVDAFGGSEAVLEKTSFYAENFLTDAEKLKIVTESLNRQMEDLGITVESTTKKQFGEMLLGFLKLGVAGADMANLMFQVGDLFIASRAEFERLANAELEAALNAGAAAGGLNSVAQSLANVALQAANAAAQQRSTIQSLRDSLAGAREGLASIQERQSSAQRQVQDRQAKNDIRQAEDDRRKETREVQRANSDQIASLQDAAGTFRDAVSKFSSAAKRIADFNDSISLGDLSPLTPQEKLNEARALFNQTRSAAFGGDAEALEKLPGAATEFLRASQVANASNATFVSDFNLVKDILKDAEGIAINERDLAADQLAGIELQIDELQKANQALGDISQTFNSGLQDVSFGVGGVSADLGVVDSSVVDVEKATNNVAAILRELTIAVLTGPGNPLISDAAIRSVVFDNTKTVQEMVDLAVEFGVSVQQVAGATGISIAAINKSIQGLAITNQAIRDFVYTPGRTNQEIYNAAIANGVTSERLATVANIPLQSINDFVRSNNLQSFAVGTDRVMRDGIAMLHRDEAVVPSSVPAEIVALRADITKMIETQNRNTERVVEATYISSRQNAQAISQSSIKVENRKGFKQRVGGGGLR